MSYLTPEAIAEAEKKYGRPVELSTVIKATADELEAIRKSQKHGRAHDITMFIFKGDQMLFIAKHIYPRGLFRAPSGAARPGESLEEGALREAREETGARIQLQKYLLRIRVKFTCGDDVIDWTSHVFKAVYVDGQIRPLDTAEIREARLVDIGRIKTFNQVMLKVGWAGFRYRVFLTRETLKLLSKELTANKLSSDEMKSQ